MTVHLTSLPCDTDPNERPEPSWLSHLTAVARIDANSEVKHENVTDLLTGAHVLRLTVVSEQGGVFQIEASDAGMAILAKAIRTAKSERDAVK